MRIASLSPAATEILFGIGVGSSEEGEHQIVCVDRFSTFPEEAKAIPHLPDHQKIRAEDVAAFRPDLVLTATVVQERLAGTLRAAGLPVVHQDPRTLAAMEESIRMLGAIVGREAEAKALLLRMRQDFRLVEKKARLLPRRPKVYIEEWHDPPFVSGNWVPDIVHIAGGEQILARSGELSREVTLEEVAAQDPELVVISWCGAGTLAPKELLLQRPGWDRLSAVRTGRVRVIDDALLNRPGPRLVEGAQRLYGWMFEVLH